MGGEQLEWLPVGWKIKVRVRSCGKKDKYYIDPTNGLKFSSKPEVLRYLKSSENDQKSNELDEIDGKKNIAGKLPPGWVKKIRTKKKGSRIRKDPYYIDPVSRRHFRSMQEVFRYLESKTDDRCHVSVELGDHSQSSSAGEAKGQRSIEKKGDKILFENQSAKLGLTRPNDGNHLEQREENDSPATKLSDELQLVNGVKKRAKRIKNLADIRVDKKSANRDQISKSGSKVGALEKLDMPILEKRDNEEDDSVGTTLSNKLPLVNMTERVNGGRRRSMGFVDNKQKDDVTENQPLQSGLKEKIISFPESIDLEQREESKSNSMSESRQHEKLPCQKKRKNPNSKFTSDLPCRALKRLARVENEHPSPEIKTSDIFRVSDAPSPSGKAEVTTSKDIGISGPLDEKPTDNQKNSITSHACKEDENRGKNPDSSLEGLFMDPCIEFAIKTLTGAIPIEVGESPVNKSSTSSTTSKPSEHIWGDPCFEFAVKMLTGEMPLGSNLDNVDRLNYSSDAVKKPLAGVEGRRGS